MPTPGSSVGCGSPAPRISFGGSGEMTALARWPSSSEFSSSNATDSSASSTRCPATGRFGNCVFTTAGFAPMNCGVESTIRPSRTVKLSER